MDASNVIKSTYQQQQRSHDHYEQRLHNNNNNNNNHHVTIVALNRPKKHNAINRKMWYEIGHVFTQLQVLQQNCCSAIILMGMGKSFCSGIDISDTNYLFSTTTSSTSSSSTNNTSLSNRNHNDSATILQNTAATKLLPQIQQMQECFTALEQCSIPIIAVIHGYCIGAGIDLICCTDIRICCTNNNNNNNNNSNTIFAVKEVQMGFAPDVGTLQRLPKICGANQSMIHELCYTGRNFDATEAMELGLVSSRYCRTTLSECLHTAMYEIAIPIMSLSNPMAVQHIKQSLLYSRHHPNVQDGLDHIANINAYALQSNVVRRIMQHQTKKKKNKMNLTKHDMGVASTKNNSDDTTKNQRNKNRNNNWYPTTENSSTTVVGMVSNDHPISTSKKSIFPQPHRLYSKL